LSRVTVVGNAMVLHAIRTERRLQTVSINTIITLLLMLKVNSLVLTISFSVKQRGNVRINVTLRRNHCCRVKAISIKYS
jgi:hypothetical protein